MMANEGNEKLMSTEAISTSFEDNLLDISSITKVSNLDKCFWKSSSDCDIFSKVQTENEDLLSMIDIENFNNVRSSLKENIDFLCDKTLLSDLLKSLDEKFVKVSENFYNDALMPNLDNVNSDIDDGSGDNSNSHKLVKFKPTSEGKSNLLSNNAAAGKVNFTRQKHHLYNRPDSNPFMYPSFDVELKDFVQHFQSNKLKQEYLEEEISKKSKLNDKLSQELYVTKKLNKELQKKVQKTNLLASEHHEKWMTLHSALQKENVTLNHKVAELVQKEREWKIENESLKKDLELSSDNLLINHKKLEEVESELKNILEENSHLNEKLKTKLKEMLALEQEFIPSLKKEISELKDCKDLLKEQVSQLSHSSSHYKKQCDLLLSKYEYLQKECHLQKEVNMNIQCKNDILSKDLEKFKANYEEEKKIEINKAVCLALQQMQEKVNMVELGLKKSLHSQLSVQRAAHNEEKEQIIKENKDKLSEACKLYETKINELYQEVHHYKSANSKLKSQIENIASVVSSTNTKMLDHSHNVKKLFVKSANSTSKFAYVNSNNVYSGHSHAKKLEDSESLTKNENFHVPILDHHATECIKHGIPGHVDTSERALPLAGNPLTFDIDEYQTLKFKSFR